MRLLNKCFVFGTIILLAGGSFMLLGQSQPCQNPPCPIYNESADQCYSTIQAAINAASPGDTICVSAGTYYENLVINTPITLIGYHMYNTNIIGACTADVIVIKEANGVTIRNFGIYGCGVISGSMYSALKIESDNNIIDTNVIAESRRNVYIYGGSGNTISNNFISSTNWSGFENITIGGSDNKIYGNTIKSSSGMGYGIVLLGAPQGAIFANHISNHEFGIYVLGTSTGTLIHHNNFQNNSTHAYIFYPSSGCQWDNGYPSGGNYWDDNTTCVDNYKGENQNEPGSDGICDDPYDIPHHQSNPDEQDSFPMVARWHRMCGNVDGNPYYEINYDDIYYLIAYLYQDGPDPVPPCSADLNCDGLITISDVSILIDHVNNGTPISCCCQ
jgi:hypothetical protein